ncbi:LutC/YkgG family protein [Parendozoicomonas haliclonae]|uniref:Lactate utilization protein C n=1 Tax=Parendozoicomonas haliclonae TaxID=1960125 RepID=A0A1X7AEQ3_9GAMM|nr:lactate utilization protein [Parendozoicomonas haliclonae]SMA35240.1 Lactate utilization protein C [Parendozoicomonas haliclonae]
MSTSIQARSNILSRLRSAQTSPLTVADDIGSAQLPERSRAEKVSRLVELMRAVKTEVHLATDEQWPQLLTDTLTAKGITSLLVSSRKETGKRLTEIEDELELIDVPDNPLSLKDDLFSSIPASLTTCRCGIAETGTLVLWPDHDEPRAMSLVPPVHCVLLKEQDIANTLADIIRVEEWAGQMPTNALLISGPSKTADIARILAYGAHGPRELVVMLVQEQEGQ